MNYNKGILFQATGTVIVWVLFSLGFFTASTFAENKIGLDLKWRPIQGVPEPAAPAPEPARLYVDTVPSDARVRILNIVPVYKQGMALDSGRYHVEVSAEGFETETQWVTLSAGKDERMNIRLDRVKTVAPEKPQVPPTAGGAGHGRAWTDPVTGMAFVWVPGGCYQMGCGSWTDNCDGDEKPVHEACLDGFWMGRTEVTVGAYRKFLLDGGDPSGVDWSDSDCPIRKGGNYPLSGNKFGSSDRQPMVEVSWSGARAFADWLSRKTGKRFRLPTEAEWEYACRSGGKPEKYAGGNDVDRVAWYSSNSGSRTHEVGAKSPNGLGLYDMSGNVWEWCQDWKGGYPSGSQKNPTGPAGGSGRVDRGGSWGSSARYVRCGDRSGIDPGVTYYFLGFRLARTN